MKSFMIIFFMLNSFFANAMNDPKKERRKSCSPSRMQTLLSKHKRRSSLGDKVLISLHLKTDEIKESSNTVDALVTNRRAPEQNAQQEVRKKSAINLKKSDSRNLIDRAGENNRNNFTQMTMLAYEAIKNIKAADDEATKQYKSRIKYARYYYISWMASEIKEYSWLIRMADQELKPIEEEFDKRMTFLKSESQKK